MKISKDFKIGLIGLVSIIVVLMIINFIRTSDIFDSDMKIHAVFPTAQGIEKNARVLMKGLPIGIVDKLQPADQNLTGVKVTFKLDKDLNIPVNSIASVSTGGPLSQAYINIEQGSSKTYVESGDIIKAKSADAASELQAQVKPLGQKINNITDSISGVLNQYNTTLDTKKQADIRNKIAALNRQMASYYAMSQTMNQNTTKALKGFAGTTNDFSRRGNEINTMLDNANTKTNRLAQLHLQRKVDSINRQITGVKSKLSNLANGRLGSMTTNRDIYNSLSEQMLQTEIMLDDIRVNPKRYVDVSVLGKSSKAPELTESEAAKRRTQQNIEFNRRQQETYKNR